MKLEKFNPFVAARLNAGYRSQDALAQVIGVKKPTYGQWEQGKFATVYEINLSGFKKMCDVFGWTYEEGINNLSNLNKWYKDPNIHIVKPTMEQAKAIAKTWKPKLTTLDTSNTDISKEKAMLDNPLKVWRGKNNLTRSEAAKLCHVDVNVYSDCEDGIKKPNGFDLTKILKGSGLHFIDIQKIFRDDTVKTVIENALEASNNPDPVTLENTTISVKICDEIDHNKVIEDTFKTSKKNEEDLNKKPEVSKDSVNWSDKIFDDMKVEKSDAAIKILNEEIDKALDNITPPSVLTLREGKVLKFYYIDNRTLRDIAQDFGLTGTRIQQIRDRALRKMKRCIESDTKHINPEASKVIDEVTTKNEYPLNFIIDRCGLPAEDWIVEEFNRQMDEKAYASKDASSYIFFKPERDAIRKVFRDHRVIIDGELLDSIDTAALTFKDHIKKSAGLIGTVAKKITEAKNEKLAKEIATVINPIYGLTSAKISKPKQDPMQKKLANQTVSYLKEEPVLNDSGMPANNSRNIAISKQTARYILRKLYGVLDVNEYYKILSEFTKGGLNL